MSLSPKRDQGRRSGGGIRCCVFVSRLSSGCRATHGASTLQTHAVRLGSQQGCRFPCAVGFHASGLGARVNRLYPRSEELELTCPRKRLEFFCEYHRNSVSVFLGDIRQNYGALACGLRFPDWESESPLRSATVGARRQPTDRFRSQAPPSPPDYVEPPTCSVYKFCAVGSAAECSGGCQTFESPLWPRVSWRRGTLQASGSGRRPPWSPRRPSVHALALASAGPGRVVQPRIQERLMSQKLFVGGLPFSTSTTELSQLFNQVAGVASVEVITHRDTGRSRGFAFVQMATSEAADEAVRKFNGYQLGGRKLKVEISKP